MASRWHVTLLLLMAAGLARAAPPDVLVEGRVVDEATGAPIVSATVAPQRVGRGVDQEPVSTGADGRFRFVREQIETFGTSDWIRPQFLVRAPGWAPAALRPTTGGILQRGVHEGLVVRLSRPLPFPGRVVDPAGAPVAGASVTVFGSLRCEGGGCEQDDDHFCGPVDWEWKTTSGPDGRFAIDDLAPDEPGLARVHVVVTGRGRRQLGRKAHDVRPGDPPLEVVLAPEAAVEGVVVDASGAPIAGARVVRYSLPQHFQGRSRPPPEEDTEEGVDRFLVRTIAGTELHVWDRAMGRFLEGDRGEPLRIRNSMKNDPGLITLTAADGTFQLRPLTPGLRHLVVAAPGLGERLLDVEAPSAGLRVVLAPERRLRGQLLRGGLPVAGAVVRLFEPGRAREVAAVFGPGPRGEVAWTTRFERGAAITDAAGRFEIARLSDRALVVAALEGDVLVALRDDVPTDGEPITLEAAPREAR